MKPPDPKQFRRYYERVNRHRRLLRTEMTIIKNIIEKGQTHDQDLLKKVLVDRIDKILNRTKPMR